MVDKLPENLLAGKNAVGSERDRFMPNRFLSFE